MRCMHDTDVSLFFSFLLPSFLPPIHSFFDNNVKRERFRTLTMYVDFNLNLSPSLSLSSTFPLSTLHSPLSALHSPLFVCISTLHLHSALPALHSPRGHVRVRVRVCMSVCIYFEQVCVVLTSISTVLAKRTFDQPTNQPTNLQGYRSMKPTWWAAVFHVRCAPGRVGMWVC